MTERLHMLLNKLNPGAGHVLVVGRGDCNVLILGTPNAGNRLTFIHQQSPLEHDVHAVETEHYRAIEADLHKRFRAFRNDGLGYWVHAEFERVIDALGEYDLTTGARVRSGELSIGDRVFVHGLGKGAVTGFTTSFNPAAMLMHERVVVQVAVGFVPVPRARVKPIIRLGLQR